MRRTYNNYATDGEQKVTACPDWVLEETSEMWKRIDETIKKTKVSINKLGKEYNFSPSSVYNTIAMVRRGEVPRDTELRIIEALANGMNVPLNYLLHGDQVSDKAEKRVDESLVDSIFSLANGNRLTLFLMAIPYLSVDELDAVRDDILTRFK